MYVEYSLCSTAFDGKHSSEDKASFVKAWNVQRKRCNSDGCHHSEERGLRIRESSSCKNAFSFKVRPLAPVPLLEPDDGKATRKSPKESVLTRWSLAYYILYIFPYINFLNLSWWVRESTMLLCHGYVCLLCWLFQFISFSSCFNLFLFLVVFGTFSRAVWTHLNPSEPIGHLDSAVDVSQLAFLASRPCWLWKWAKTFPVDFLAFGDFAGHFRGRFESLNLCRPKASNGTRNFLQQVSKVFMSGCPFMRFQLPIFSNEILMCLETCWASNSKLPSRTPVPLAWQPDTELGGKMRKIGLGRVRDWEIVRVRKSGEVHSKGKSHKEWRHNLQSSNRRYSRTMVTNYQQKKEK